MSFADLYSRALRGVERIYGEAFAGAVFAEHPRLLPEGIDREGAINRE